MAARKKVDHKELTELHAEGWKHSELAEYFGCSASHITRLRKDLGLHRRVPTMTSERKAQLETMLDEGLSFKEIHRTEGVDVGTLRKHFPGRAWSIPQRSEFYSNVRQLNEQIQQANYATTPSFL